MPNYTSDIFFRHRIPNKPGMSTAPSFHGAMCVARICAEFCSTLAEITGLENWARSEAGLVHADSVWASSILLARLKARILNDTGLGPTWWSLLDAIGGQVSGSIVLQVALGETWPSSDIDVILKENKGLIDDVKLHDPQHNGEEEKSRHFMRRMHAAKEKRRLRPEDFTNNAYMDQINGVLSVISAGLGGHVIQFIYVDRDPSKWIEEQFDFEFLKNRANGHSLHISHPKAIFRRSSQNVSTCRATTQHYRCLKYLQRGFSIPGYVIPDQIRIAILDGDHPGSVAMRLIRLLVQYYPTCKLCLVGNASSRTNDPEIWRMLRYDDATIAKHSVETIF